MANISIPNESLISACPKCRKDKYEDGEIVGILAFSDIKDFVHCENCGEYPLEEILKQEYINPTNS